MYVVTRQTVTSGYSLTDEVRVITAVNHETAYKALLPIVHAHTEVLTALGVDWAHRTIPNGEVIRATGTDMEIVWTIVDLDA